MKLARARGQDHAAGQPLRHQPQDSRRGVRDRRAQGRGRPARRRPRQRPHGHGRTRHPARALRAAAAGALPRSRRHAAESPRRSACSTSTAASGGLLSSSTRTALDTLATEAGVAIENARLYRETLEKARIEHELRIAAEIQQALLPPKPARRRLLRGHRHVAALAHHRRRLLRRHRDGRRQLRRSCRGRRGGQGAGGGLAHGEDSGHLLTAYIGESAPARRMQRVNTRVDAPRHRCALRHRVPAQLTPTAS
jgi:hypothetical protein